MGVVGGRWVSFWEGEWVGCITCSLEAIAISDCMGRDVYSRPFWQRKQKGRPAWRYSRTTYDISCSVLFDERLARRGACRECTCAAP